MALIEFHRAIIANGDSTAVSSISLAIQPLAMESHEAGEIDLLQLITAAELLPAATNRRAIIWLPSATSTSPFAASHSCIKRCSAECRETRLALPSHVRPRHLVQER